jgi:cystathionine beta-lyase
MSLETMVVAHNPAKGDQHGSSTVPLYQTSTFCQPSATDFGAYDYTRSGNPTRDAAQKALALVDGAAFAYCYSTGMAAIMAVTRFAKAGQEVVLSDDSYGGTYRLLAQVASQHNIPTKFVDLSGRKGAARLAAAMTIHTALVMCESPTNPMMRICDISVLAATAHAATPGKPCTSLLT